MSTYADLIADAAAILRGPDISTLLLTYAQQAIRDVQKNPFGPIYENQKTATIAVAAAALQGTLPADFGRTISAKFSGEKLPMDERHARVFLELGWPDNSDNFSDKPSEFAIFGTLLITNGQYGEAKNITLRYAPWEPAPANGTVTFPYSEKLYDVVVSKLVQLGFIDQRDDAGQVTWEKIYIQRLSDYLGISSRVGAAAPVSKTMTVGR